MSVGMKLEPAPISEVLVAPYKRSLLDSLERMREGVRRTTHLHSVFNNAWFQKLGREISNYSDEESFETHDHAAFIGFLRGKVFGKDFFENLDENFGAIKNLFRVHGIRKLEDRLKDLARPLDQYWGTVFSTIIVSQCAQHGLLKSPQDYEPKVGNNYADALLTVGQDRIILEATACISGRVVVSGEALEDVGLLANKINDKVLDKASQLKDSTEPVLLFLHVHYSMVGPDIKRGLELAFGEESTQVIAGVIVVIDAVPEWKFIYTRNPSAGSRQAPEAVLAVLERVFNFTEVRLDVVSWTW